jgi:hypothetical protein
MSAVSSQVRDAGAILPAVDAITNTKALAVEFVAMAVGVALFGLFASMGMSSMSFSAFGLAFLLFLLCAGTGFNAAGVVLMDEASGASSRSFADALLAGLFALGKAIVVMILAGLAFIGVVLAVALLLWICKIPVVGPVLFFIVFPLSAVTIGVLFVAFAFVLAPIASPAIWSGESIGTALARVAMVIRKRLVGVVVRACVLFVLLIVTAMVLWWIALAGTLTAGSLSLGIVGVDTNLASLTSMFGGGFDSGYGRGVGGYGRTPRGMTMPGAMAGTSSGGYGVAMLVSIGLIMAALSTLLSLVLKKGWCLIYLQTAKDLDVSAVEAEMQAKLAQVRAQAQAARERVQQQNLAARHGATGDAGSSNPPSA